MPIAKPVLPHIEFSPVDEDLTLDTLKPTTEGDVYLNYKAIDKSDDVGPNGEAYVELGDPTFAWAKKLAKQLKLPLYVSVKTRNRIED